MATTDQAAREDAEIVEIVVPTPSDRWQPVVGTETLSLLDHLGLPSASRDTLRDEAIQVLRSCHPPRAANGQETGLAVGYVQSGKTMSFTTVAALARDNGYAMVVVMAGTSLPLLGQSTRRLQADLRLQRRNDRAWLHVESGYIHKAAVRDGLRQTIADWHDTRVPPSLRRTVLLTTMKQHSHLKKVIAALRLLNLEGLAVLVIDDEADQASLNTSVLQRRESTTYKQIKALRSALPHHTYLQYTATPQAPLLINIIDMLSPGFAEVLTPGPEYVGGKHFFHDVPGLIELIPDHELPSAGGNEPPESLLAALRLFFVGVAVGLKEGGNGNRSMMVHPSQQTAGHSEYYGWVKTILENWRAVLDPSGAYPDDREDLLGEFRAAHVDLQETEPGLMPFEEIAPMLERAIRLTVVEEINAAEGRTPEIDWQSHYSWILVGGQAMDRGFTVEGLTVSYMPRGIGIGNADTVQQRARFFGYKRAYLGYCRIFLERSAREAFERYVEHEEDMRRRLASHRLTGAPLAEWKRAFFLDPMLQPTRKGVLDLGYYRAPAESDWYWMKAPHDSADAIPANRRAVNDFLARLVLVPDEGSEARSDFVRHNVATNIPLRFALEELLTKLHITYPVDSSQFTLVQILLREYLERTGDARCTIYEMSPAERRERSVNARDEIVNLFQGAVPPRSTAERNVGDIYPGDRELASRHPGVTVEIHRLTIKKDDGIIATDVPTIAVYIPAEASQPLLVQDQPAQNKSA